MTRSDASDYGRGVEQELKANLLALGAAFQAADGVIADSTMWRRAVRDSGFAKRIAAGGGFTVRVYDDVVAWFDLNWPAGAQWPQRVARPSQARPSQARLELEP